MVVQLVKIDVNGGNDWSWRIGGKDWRIEETMISHTRWVCNVTLIDSECEWETSENFYKKCMEIYEVNTAYCLPAPGLEWPECHTKTEVELELLTDIDMPLIVEKGMREGMCHAVGKQKPTTNTWKTMIWLQNIILMHWNVKKSMGKFRFADDSIQDYEKVSDKYYILEVDVKYLKLKLKKYTW